ncbi:unnamed protein product [Rotaria sordida]|uniref:Uncharacterized protein n=1 Tax=Rotaria sordida TaxID=392033 RepID=A0A819K2K7_9BILA|nr:unnamed protein product [Rotaria sordida]
MDETALQALIDTNADKFEQKGDSLVVFTYWFLVKYNFDLMENDKVVNQFDFTKRGLDGGFLLMYSINKRKMEPQDGSPEVDFRLKIESKIKGQQQQERQIGIELQKPPIASSNDACTDGASIDDVLDSGTSILLPEKQDLIT